MPDPLNEHYPTPSTQRGSLPRLSSLASLQAFNLFSRRRSNNNLSPNNTSSHSSSTISLTQRSSRSISYDQNSKYEKNGSQNLPVTEPDTSNSKDQVSALSVGGRWPWRQSSSHQLSITSDQVIPRSSTLSSIPVPIVRNTEKSRSKVIQPLRSSQQKSISSRIASPPIVNEKHSTTVSKLFCADTPRSKRSRRELPYDNAAGNAGKTEHKRSARVFNENFRISPTQILSPMSEEEEKTDLYGSPPSPSEGISLLTPAVQDTSLNNADLHYNSSNNVTHRFEAPSSTLQFQNKSHRWEVKGQQKSDPSTSSKPMQRWNSQPTITTLEAPQIRPRGTTRVDRLVSEAQLTTPQHSHQRACNEKEERSIISNNRLPSSGNFKSLPTPPSKKELGDVDTYEPIEFWAGRLVALCDRYRNEELQLIISFPDAKETRPDSMSSENMHSAAATIARQQRALEELYVKCKNEDAKSSLIAFQSHVSAINGNGDLAKPLPGHTLKTAEPRGLGSNTSAADLVSGSSSTRRRAFIDRLLGKSSFRVAKLEDDRSETNSSGKRLSWV